MRFVKYDIHASREDVLLSLGENDSIVEHEKFDTSRGIPRIYVKEGKKGRIKICCEYIGRGTKDNAFLEGTYFIGTLGECGDVAQIKGMVRRNGA